MPASDRIVDLDFSGESASSEELIAGYSEAASAPAVRCENVGKIFQSKGRRNVVLGSVSFEVADGEFVSLLGPSGCGKSTILMMVAGLETITQGSIAVAGEPVAGPPDGIGIMFQDATLLPWRTALDNVLFPIDVLRRPTAADVARAQELLTLVGLGRVAGYKPRQLSGGMRQRIALCRSLVCDPAILLMDEPFSALDAITRDDMNVTLLDLWQKYRKSVLFVTHSIREAVLLSDRVIVLGGKPATIIRDLRVPFSRPRDFSLSDRADFSELCAELRDAIKTAREETMAVLP